MVIDIRTRLPTEAHISDMFLTKETDLSNYPNLYSGTRKSFDQGEFNTDIAKFVEHLEDLGIEKACVSSAESVKDAVGEFPNFFVGKASIDLSNGITNELDHLEQQFSEYGFGMLELAPFADETISSSREYYPFYAKCVEYDVPVWIHSSSNFTRFSISDHGHPRYLDEICCDFPDLRVVAGHGGWPWTQHLCALLWKHPNLYVDFSAQRAKYVGQNTDWAPLREYGTTVLAEKVLFGTSFPAVDHETQLNDVRALDLAPETEQKWLHDNAEAVLGL